MSLHLQERLTTTAEANLTVPPELYIAILTNVHPKIQTFIDAITLSSEDRNFNIKRRDFNGAVSGTLQVLEQTVQSALRQLESVTVPGPADGVRVSLDEVILVGGSSRVPAVRDTLRDCLSACGQTQFGTAAHPIRDFCHSINADEAVAQGLAVRGAVLMGVKEGVLKDLLVMDALPVTIGVRSFINSNFNSSLTVRRSEESVTDGDIAEVEQEDYFEPLLLKGATLPASASKIFQLEDPSQRMVSLDVYEEGCEEVDPEITLVGTYDIPVPPRPQGTGRADTHNLPPPFVILTLHCDEERRFSFDVEWCDPNEHQKRSEGKGEAKGKHNESRGNNSSGMEQSTMIILVCYIILLGILFVIIKLYIRDSPSSDGTRKQEDPKVIAQNIFNDIIEKSKKIVREAKQRDADDEF